MTVWQSIETAPKDGTRVLLADGKLFAAGQYYVRIGTPTTLLGYNEGVVFEDGPFAGSPRIGPRFSEVVPNPKAGQIEIEFWDTDPPSAFKEADKQTSDYDGSFYHWEPTHWMPLPEAPAA